MHINKSELRINYALNKSSNGTKILCIRPIRNISFQNSLKNSDRCRINLENNNYWEIEKELKKRIRKD